MKKKFLLKLLFGLLIIPSLSGCSIFDDITPLMERNKDKGSSSEGSDANHQHKSNEEYHYDEKSHWFVCSECGKKYNEEDHDFSSSVSGSSITYTCHCGYSYVVPVGDLDTITIDSSNFNSDVYGTYSTGNYGSTTISEWGLEYYRICSSYDYSFEMLHCIRDSSDGTLPGAFYNKSAKGLIYSLIISYKSTSSFTIRYGSAALENTTNVAASSYGTNTEVVISNYFFSIETGNSDVYISSIMIRYSATSTHTKVKTAIPEKDYSIEPVKYSGSLVAGSSYVDVPVSISRDGSSYSVISTKRYTYYTYSYIESNPSYASEAALTEPEDVANYYQAFGTYPANYVEKSQGSAAASLFGSSKVRVASYYTYTTGYATTFPYNTPVGYYELDIGLSNSYSYNSRGTARLVVWVNGFTVYGSGRPVIVYTDDHYYTFKEYLNYGSFGQRFDSSGIRVGYYYTQTITM